MRDYLKTGIQAPRPSLMEVLESRGYRPTAPRKAIAKLLEQKDAGFTVEALSEELPSVGRATVYRTINLFLEAGVICKLLMMNGSRVFSLTRAGHRHHHSVCVQCGAVREFDAAAIDRSLRAIGAEIPGQIVDHHIELYVTCHDCPAGK